MRLKTNVNVFPKCICRKLQEIAIAVCNMWFVLLVRNFFQLPHQQVPNMWFKVECHAVEAARC